MGGAGSKEAKLVKSFFETSFNANEKRLYPEMHKFFDENKNDIDPNLRVDVKCDDKTEHKNYNIIQALTLHSSDDIDLLQKFLTHKQHTPNVFLTADAKNDRDAISLLLSQNASAKKDVIPMLRLLLQNVATSQTKQPPEQQSACLFGEPRFDYLGIASAKRALPTDTVSGADTTLDPNFLAIANLLLDHFSFNLASVQNPTGTIFHVLAQLDTNAQLLQRLLIVMNNNNNKIPDMLKNSNYDAQFDENGASEIFANAKKSRFLPKAFQPLFGELRQATPLHVAAFHCNVAAVRFFAGNGLGGDVRLMKPCFGIQEPALMGHAILFACMQEDAEKFAAAAEVVSILVALPGGRFMADKPDFDNQASPITLAIKNKNVALIKVLVGAGGVDLGTAKLPEMMSRPKGFYGCTAKEFALHLGVQEEELIS